MHALPTTPEHLIQHAWLGRAQELFTVTVGMHPANMESFTAGWVLGILHGDHGPAPSETKLKLTKVLLRYPGFKESPDGMYFYGFIQQLEFVCDAVRKAYHQQLMK